VQSEPALAQSTYCRKCGEHFRVGVAVSEGIVVATLRPPAKEGGWLAGARQAFGPRGPRHVVCFDCGAEQDVAPAARSTICPSCSSYIDLTDFKIDNASTKNIRTRGILHIGPKGDLSATRAECADAIIEGRLRAELYASGPVRVLVKGKVFGGITASQITIEKKAVAECSRTLHCARLEVFGTLQGDVVVTGAVVIHKHAKLIGDIRACSIQVDKGGFFEGAMAIEPAATKSAPENPAPTQKPTVTQNRPRSSIQLPILGWVPT